ncbi:hypothetical protein QFZ24_002822 [Streptomyces phaeochromogenes]|nr:hypothetical protein [Streptomyces phaeochromogenes]
MVRPPPTAASLTPVVPGAALPPAAVSGAVPPPAVPPIAVSLGAASPTAAPPGGPGTVALLTPATVNRGTAASSRLVYSCAGRSRTSSTGPVSTISPSSITATRSAKSATTPMLWVTSRTPVPESAASARSRSRISAWTVTSSAVVGSSAISRLGEFAIAMAMTTRCRCPPESWKGYEDARFSGSGIPTRRSSPTASAAASRAETGRWLRTTSAICAPIRVSGSRAVAGSWNTIDTVRPRKPTRSVSAAPTTSAPSTEARPDARAFPGSSPIAASATVDFPDPDSPTSASVSPGRTYSDTPRTAGTSPVSVEKVTPRSSTSRMPLMPLVPVVPLMPAPSRRTRPAARPRPR